MLLIENMRFFIDVTPFLLLSIQLVYKDVSSGVLNKIMMDWFGGLQGTYIALLVYVACVIVNLEACILVQLL
jgi:hypothetical protein